MVAAPTERSHSAAVLQDGSTFLHMLIISLHSSSGKTPHHVSNLLPELMSKSSLINFDAIDLWWGPNYQPQRERTIIVRVRICSAGNSFTGGSHLMFSLESGISEMLVSPICWTVCLKGAVIKLIILPSSRISFSTKTVRERRRLVTIKH